MNRLAALAAALLIGGPALAVDTAPAAGTGLDAARTAIDAGDYAAAITALEQALATAPGDADTLNLLGYANRKAGNLDAASDWYAQALAADPDHLGALEYQGELFVMLNDMAAAEANLARLRSLCGDCEEAGDLLAAITAATAGG